MNKDKWNPEKTFCSIQGKDGLKEGLRNCYGLKDKGNGHFTNDKQIYQKGK